MHASNNQMGYHKLVGENMFLGILILEIPSLTGLISLSKKHLFWVVFLPKATCCQGYQVFE